MHYRTAPRERCSLVDSPLNDTGASSRFYIKYSSIQVWQRSRHLRYSVINPVVSYNLIILYPWTPVRDNSNRIGNGELVSHGNEGGSPYSVEHLHCRTRSSRSASDLVID